MLRWSLIDNHFEWWFLLLIETQRRRLILWGHELVLIDLWTYSMDKAYQLDHDQQCRNWVQLPCVLRHAIVLQSIGHSSPAIENSQNDSKASKWSSTSLLTKAWCWPKRIYNGLSSSYVQSSNIWNNITLHENVPNEWRRMRFWKSHSMNNVRVVSISREYLLGIGFLNWKANAALAWKYNTIRSFKHPTRNLLSPVILDIDRCVVVIYVVSHGINRDHHSKGSVRQFPEHHQSSSHHYIR